MAEDDDDYFIEQFSPTTDDIPKLAALINAAFKDPKGSLGFNDDTFNLMFGSPYTEKDLFVRVFYKPTNELVGFTGAIPRNIVYQGKTYKFGIGTWASVHADHQKKGLGQRMGLKLIDIGKERDYDGGIGTFEPERHGKDAARHVVASTGMPVQDCPPINKMIVRILNLGQIARIVGMKGIERFGLKLLHRPPTPMNPPNPRIRIFNPDEDGERIYELMADHVTHNQLSFVREHDDFLWYFHQPGILCIVNENDQRQVDGFLLAWKMMLAGATHEEPFGWMDNVHFYNLTPRDAVDMCKCMCIEARDMGWAGLQMPHLPYFDHHPFRKAGFLLIPRDVFMKLYYYKPVDFPRKITSFYFDWR